MGGAEGVSRVVLLSLRLRTCQGAPDHNIDRARQQATLSPSKRSTPVSAEKDTPLQVPPKPTSLPPTVEPLKLPASRGVAAVLKHWGTKLDVREGVAEAVGVGRPYAQFSV